MCLGATCIRTGHTPPLCYVGTYLYCCAFLLSLPPYLSPSLPSLPLSLSISVTFDTQASCHMWQDRLRKVICGAKDLDKTFAFVHWAYSTDQQAEELLTQHGSAFTSSESLQEQHSFEEDHFHTHKGTQTLMCIPHVIMLLSVIKLLVLPNAVTHVHVSTLVRT